MKKHIGNISRLAGNDVSVRYGYAVDKDSIVGRYMQMRSELGYPLVIDSRNRRAVVYNKKGVEKEIQKLIDKCVISEVKQMENMIANDVVDLITYHLNGIPQYNNNVKSNGVIRNISSAMVMGLAKGVVDIVDDMINNNDK